MQARRRRFGFRSTTLMFTVGLIIVGMIGALPFIASDYREFVQLALTVGGFLGVAALVLVVALAEWIDDLVLGKHDRAWHRLVKFVFIVIATILPVVLYLLKAVDLVDLCLILLGFGLFIGFRAAAAQHLTDNR